MRKINAQQGIISTPNNPESIKLLYREKRTEFIKQLTTKGELWLFTVLEDLDKDYWILTSKFVDRNDRTAYDNFRKAANSFVKKGFLSKVMSGFFMKKGAFADLHDLNVQEIK